MVLKLNNIWFFLTLAWLYLRQLCVYVSCLYLMAACFCVIRVTLSSPPMSPLFPLFPGFSETCFIFHILGRMWVCRISFHGARSMKSPLPPSSSSIPNRFPSSATENTKNIYIYIWSVELKCLANICIKKKLFTLSPNWRTIRCHRPSSRSSINAKPKKRNPFAQKIPTPLAFFGLQNEVGKVSPKKKTENRASKSARITHNQFHNFIQDQLLV